MDVSSSCMGSTTMTCSLGTTYNAYGNVSQQVVVRQELRTLMSDSHAVGSMTTNLALGKLLGEPNRTGVISKHWGRRPSVHREVAIQGTLLLCAVHKSRHVTAFELVSIYLKTGLLTSKQPLIS